MQFRDLKEVIRSDYERFSSRPDASFLRIIWSCRRNIVLAAIANYRFRHWLHLNGRRSRLWAVPVRILFPGKPDISINTEAVIGGGLLIYHGNGLVIGSRVRAGRGLTLEHGVTIGNRFRSKAAGADRCPILGDHVFVGCGAKILGSITIGHHAKIGAAAVVLNDVPDHATAVGIPARVIQSSADSKD